MNIKNLFKKEFHLPKSKEMAGAVKSLSLNGKIIFYFFMAVFVISALLLLYNVNQSFIVEIPAEGGTINEGIIGTPRFINPLLATSDADRDMAELVYSGLLRATPEGKLINDLCQSWSVSADNLTYTFILKDNIFFQDGTPVSADDVEFTVLKAQDQTLKSPRLSSWQGVTVQKVDAKTIKFILKQPYAPFIENMTLGILPKHLWKDATSDDFAFSEYNSMPVGSGPYKVESVKKSSLGIPNYYHLVAFNKFVLGKPYITDLVIKFYQNEKSLLDGLNSGSISNINSISPDKIIGLDNSNGRIVTATLPRVFGVFFNQNQAPVLANQEVRQALEEVTFKDKIIKEALGGYGKKADGPIPFENSASDKNASSTNSLSEEASIASAKKLLADNGWKIASTTGALVKKGAKSDQTLQFAISTPDTPELVKVAEMLKDDWSKIGAKIDIKISEAGSLNQNVIRPRKYDALLFGEVVGRDMDLYAFWHSSQRVGPGSKHRFDANAKVDKLLLSARAESNEATRDSEYKQAEQEIKNDIPAIFLYSPDFIYVVQKDIQNINLGQITTPAERFLDIKNWFIETDKVWKIFAR